ncbi:hypothetical protein STCU_10515 [Strigomonas culicis]|uniref:Uncharacterized protein n=1 Tax=Strigomonas culicis TaxID=28005 RepID=S9TMQ8_9TRYP|nr:hypothetical protein STCU_10515 [Strigomonas culicis]|eukprot:EPY17618.1 hypothetical protein STCU_10515 [Strigomonas culicis]
MSGGRTPTRARHGGRDAIQQPFSHVSNNLLLLYLYLRVRLHRYVESFPVPSRPGAARGRYLRRHVQHYILFAPQSPLLRAKRRFLRRLLRPAAPPEDAGDAVHLVLLGDWHAARAPHPSRPHADVASLLRYPLPFWHATGAAHARAATAALPFGLAGHAHTPSLNALLRELAAPRGCGAAALQFADVLVDGPLQIPAWRSRAAMERFDGAAPRRSDFPTASARALGVLRAANTLALQPAPPCAAAEDGGEERSYVLLCNLHPAIARKQQTFYKAVADAGGGGAGAVRDAWEAADRRGNTTRGIFGFMSFSSPTHRPAGKVAIFTDTSCLSNFNSDFQTQVHHALLQEEGVGYPPSDLAAFFCFEVVHLLLTATHAAAPGEEGDERDGLPLVRRYAGLQCQSAPPPAAAAEADPASPLGTEEAFAALAQLLREGRWPPAAVPATGAGRPMERWVGEGERAPPNASVWDVLIRDVSTYDEDADKVSSSGATTGAAAALPPLFFEEDDVREGGGREAHRGSSDSSGGRYALWAAWGAMVVANGLLLALGLFGYYRWSPSSTSRRAPHRKKTA